MGFGRPVQVAATGELRAQHLNLVADLQRRPAFCAARQQGRNHARRAWQYGLIGRITGINVKPEINHGNFMALGYQDAQAVR